MLSLEPSIKRGLTFWDRALLSPDEFDERVRLVREDMRRRGLAAIVIAGNMYEDEDLVFLVGYNVDGVFVLPAQGEPAIFTNSGSRESFFLRELTWVSDLSHRGAQTGAAVAETLRSCGVTSGRIGVAGLQVLAVQPYNDLVRNLAAYQIEDFTPGYRALRQKLRPRERAAMRVAFGMADAAAIAAEKIYAAGASNASAVIEAERVARRVGAWDVRILSNLDGDELRPFERLSDERRDPFLMWVATRYQGYWAARAVNVPADPKSEAARAVAAMSAAARPGAPAGEIAAAGLVCLSEASRRTALAYGLGGCIGLAMDAPPLIRPDSREVLARGMTLLLHVFAEGGDRPSLAGAMIEIGANGAQTVDAIPASLPPITATVCA
ncbi:hypothetical protein BIWAKO_06951 [Bosea sp. BIWAKO-01]|nr:hypothetical protein BIWAKO_06951 [Bosea sp. BIWAKO-01]